MGFGWTKYLFGDDRLYIIAYGGESLERLDIRARAPPDCEADDRMTEVAVMAKEWILFGKEGSTEYALNATPFQSKVLEATLRIPKGYVSTYSAIASSIGCKAYRAVGQALNKNCLPLFIPCHRVVKKGGEVGGFECGSDLKEQILTMEGVKIHDGKVDPSHILEKV